MRLVRRVGIGVSAASLFVMLASVSTHAATPASHNLTLKNASISVVSPTELVVTMEATGDLRGQVTFTINHDGQTITGGEWALVSRYAEYLDATGMVMPDGLPNSGDESVPHNEGTMRLVDNGTISGALTGGLITSSDAGPSGLVGVVLTINGGSLTFTGAQGGGSASASNLQPQGTATGALQLSF